MNYYIAKKFFPYSTPSYSKQLSENIAADAGVFNCGT